MKLKAESHPDKFGLLNSDCQEVFNSWKGFINNLIENRTIVKNNPIIEVIAQLTESSKSSLILTDVNMGNFVFEKGNLKVAIDIERSLWGDKQFLYSVMKKRNINMFRIATQRKARSRTKIVGLLWGDI